MSDIVERLRCLPSGWLEHMQAEDTVIEAIAEIERLRGLLQELLDGEGPTTEYLKRVREALGG